ncbi:unnamed protein product [Rodentolepis nana]|uniref:RING-type domain-containing protein n=1 Tax=Rodentolepis nana TaxID=102285 RepID=A0A0R3THK5_RODNA|nr:unnamed protein product [Rodentolepis nana]
MKPGTTFDIIPMVMPATNQCSICLEEMKAPIGMLGGCKHIFCYDCIKKWSEAKRTCPIDRTPFDSINILHEIGGAIVEEEKLELRSSNQSNSSYGDGDDVDDYDINDLISRFFGTLLDYSSDEEDTDYDNDHYDDHNDDDDNYVVFRLLGFSSDDEDTDDDDDDDNGVDYSVSLAASPNSLLHSASPSRISQCIYLCSQCQGCVLEEDMVMPATNQCSICLEEMKASIGMLGGCDHIFCYDCIKKWSEANRTCPLDRTPFDSINILHEIGGAIVEEEKIKPLELDQIYSSTNVGRQIEVNRGVPNFICPLCRNRERRMN